MDDIQDFITDHHYNQAIRKKTVVSPEEAIAEAVLDTWPPLPKDVAASESLSEFASKVTFETMYQTPVGRYFLLEILVKRPVDQGGFPEEKLKSLGRVVRMLEDFRLEKHHSMVLVKRFVEKFDKVLSDLPMLAHIADKLHADLDVLQNEYQEERGSLLRSDPSGDPTESNQDGEANPVLRNEEEEEIKSPEDRNDFEGDQIAEDEAKDKSESSAHVKGIDSAELATEKNRSPGTNSITSRLSLRSRMGTARMATLSSSQMSGIELTDVPDEKIQAIVALEDLFFERYSNFFTGLENAVQGVYRASYDEFKGDLERVERYRLLEWYSIKKEIRMGDFVIFRDLGRGAFGVVSGARHRITGQLVALKGMNRKLVKGKKVLKLVKQEFQILKKLGEFPSPFCVSLSYAFMEESDMYFGLPLMTGGDLMYHICREHKGYGVERARFFAAEILLGVQHMHNLGIIYRDLKPENVLLDEDGHTKISDMGLAVLVKFTPYTRGNKLIRGRAGTPGYWPPEMIKGEGYAFDADWWSWAAMLYEFIAGICPFSEHHTKLKDRNDATLNWEITFPDSEEEPFPEDAKDLLLKMLERDRYKRLGTQPDTAEQIMAHPFFKDIDWAEMESGKSTAPWKPPSNAINAISQADLESRNKEAKFKKIVLTEEDKIEGFNFKSREHLYDIELVLNLERMGKLDHLKLRKSQHCAIL